MVMQKWSDKLPAERRIKLVPFDKIQLGTDRRYLVKGLIPYPGLTVIWGRLSHARVSGRRMLQRALR
jgi:hypothetical protein